MLEYFAANSLKLHVLHAVGSLNRGGIETWLTNLVRQRSDAVQFDFIVSKPGGVYEDELKKYGCNIFTIPPENWLRKRMNIIGIGKNNRTLEEILSKRKYDVFHAHGTEFLGDAVKTAALCGVKVRAAHCHTTGIGRFERNFEMRIRGLRFKTLDRHRVLKYASDILAVSRESGHFFVSDYWETDRRCKTLYCGVPLDDFKNALKLWTRDKFRQSSGIPDNAIVIGHAGSMWLSGVKNHLFLLKVFKELTKRNVRYFLYMAGDGPLRPKIEKEILNLGIEHRVFLPGIVSDIPSLMIHGFDVHVLPSLYEGLPIAGLEAAASGLFTVCSDTITKDFSEKLAPRVKSVSLEAGVREWADEVEKAVVKRITPEEGIAFIQDSPFSIRSSLNNILEIYRYRLLTGEK